MGERKSAAQPNPVSFIREAVAAEMDLSDCYGLSSPICIIPQGWDNFPSDIAGVVPVSASLTRLVGRARQEGKAHLPIYLVRTLQTEP